MTKSTGTQFTVRVTCDCKVCKTNAAKVGATFPLAAFMNTTAATRLGIKDGAKDHDAVHLAHDPIMGRFQSVAVAVR